MQYGSKLGKRKKGTGYFFSHCKRLPYPGHKDILQVGLMNQAPTTGKKVACPLFLQTIFHHENKACPLFLQTIFHHEDKACPQCCLKII